MKNRVLFLLVGFLSLAQGAVGAVVTTSTVPESVFPGEAIRIDILIHNESEDWITNGDIRADVTVCGNPRSCEKPGRDRWLRPIHTPRACRRVDRTRLLDNRPSDFSPGLARLC